ncbi:hypothetical protein V1478_003036 [Vespula squamosa]|uniref:Uncharacterized protein n=1 Tax=Vespula squamosa TaxID=30214 RepID=A0ABD2BRJ5_VESSQ
MALARRSRLQAFQLWHSSFVAGPGGSDEDVQKRVPNTYLICFDLESAERMLDYGEWSKYFQKNRLIGSRENGEMGGFQYQYFVINALLNPPGEGKNIFPGRDYFGSFFPTADILRKVCLKMDEIGVPREKVAEVINDYQSTASTWVSSRLGVRRVRAASTRESEEGGGVDGDRERERVDDVWSFANMNVLSVTAAPCQERTAC